MRFGRFFRDRLVGAKARTRHELLQAVFTMPLDADPGSRAEYSDIGFILLGVALERLADESLDRFCQREIFAPLGMISTTFNAIVSNNTTSMSNELSSTQIRL